jgi:hypothetical protein
MFMSHVRGVDLLHNIAHPPHTRFKCCNFHCYTCNVRHLSGISNVLKTTCLLISVYNSFGKLNKFACYDVNFGGCYDVLRHFGLVSQYSSLIQLNYTCCCKCIPSGTGFDCLQQLDNTCCNDNKWTKNNYFNALTGCCCCNNNIFCDSCSDLACKSDLD